jgi:hypothetical protein
MFNGPSRSARGPLGPDRAGPLRAAPGHGPHRAEPHRATGRDLSPWPGPWAILTGHGPLGSGFHRAGPAWCRGCRAAPRRRALPAPNYMVIYVFWVKLDGPNYIIYVHCGLGQITCSLYIFWAKLDGPPPGQSGQRTGPAPGHKPRQWPMPVRTPGQARYRAILSGLGPGHGSRAKWPTILFSTTRVIKFETVASR